MRIATVLGLGALGFLIAPPAQALTISNTDPKPHTVTVKTGGDSAELTIEPDMAVEPPCQTGCIVELENGEQYEMKGDEEVSIEGGTIFVDAVPSGDDDDTAAGGDSGEPSEDQSHDSAEAHPDTDAEPQ